MTFEAFCRNVASAVGDLHEGEGGEVHIEIIARASVRAGGFVNDFGKAVRARLSEADCVFLPRGKGDHDLWITKQADGSLSRFK